MIVKEEFSEHKINIKTPFLMELFKGNGKKAIEMLQTLKREVPNKVWDNDYEHDVLIFFWLAIHMENIEVTR